MKIKQLLMWICFGAFWVCALGLAVQIGSRGLGMWMAGWVIMAFASGVSMHFCHDIYMDDRLPKLGKWWGRSEEGLNIGRGEKTTAPDWE